ncbi:cell division protein FtsQ/DivIB [Lacinutrix salivirga]
MMVLLVIVVFLYAFSSQRNGNRKVEAPKVEFIGDNNLFITHETVSKLLIQNKEGVKNMPKETLDLNGLESALNSNNLIASAEVYLNVNGALIAEVKQKKPIARVLSKPSYYVDTNGKYMPLSTNYAERVPLVTGAVKKTDLETVYTMAKKITEDEFLKQHVIEIHQNADKTIDLKLRKCNFNVHVGRLNQLDKKINNLKVFYKKAMKDKTLDIYKTVNLQFDNQVVCTKF